MNLNKGSSHSLININNISDLPTSSSFPIMEENNKNIPMSQSVHIEAEHFNYMPRQSFFKRLNSRRRHLFRSRFSPTSTNLLTPELPPSYFERRFSIRNFLHILDQFREQLFSLVPEQLKNHRRDQLNNANHLNSV